MFRHLRTTISVAFGSLIVGVIGLVIWQTTTAIEKQALHEIEVNTQTTQNIVEQLLRDKTEELLRGAKLLAKDIGFRESVADNAADKNYASMADSVQNFMQRMPMDEFMVTDDWGQVLADVAIQAENGKQVFLSGQFKPGEDVTGMFPVIQEALETPEDFSKPNIAISKDGKLMQSITSNVLAPTLYGVIWFGWYLDNAKAASIKKISGAEISFVNGERIVSSTFTGKRQQRLQAALSGRLKKAGQGARFKPFDLEMEGETWRSQLVPLVKDNKFPGAYLIQFSLDQALGPLEQVKGVLFLVGFVGVGFAIAASLFIASGITLPVRKLADGAHAIGEGDLRVRINVKRRDELGALASAFNDMVTGLEEKERMRSIMNKVVSKEVAEEMIGKDISLGGEEREVSILFSDIRSFTSLSESLPASELVAQLNEYLTAMSHQVDKHRGVIDKYIGDAIMAVWGAPLKHDQDADSAVRCGLDMLSALAELNKKRTARSQPPFKIGIGVSSGEVVAGNTGSDQRLNYTVLGDEVNLASRVESLTKQYGVMFIITENTRVRLKGRYVMRELDHVTVKGQSKPVAIYEVLAEEPASDVVA